MQSIVFSGCAHELEGIQQPLEFMNRTWIREPGGSSAHIYRARHPNSRTGYAVVKIMCMPFSKTSNPDDVPPCRPELNEVCAQLCVPLQHCLPRCWLQEGL